MRWKLTESENEAKQDNNENKINYQIYGMYRL